MSAMSAILKSGATDRYSLQDLKHHALEFERKQNAYQTDDNKIKSVAQRLLALKKRRRFQDIHDIRVLEEKLTFLRTRPPRIPIETLCLPLIATQKHKHRAQQIIFNRLFKKEQRSKKKGTQNQVYHCQCGADRLANFTTGTLACSTCGHVQQMLLKNAPTTLGEEIEKNPEYNRVPLYTKFLRQYLRHDIEIDPQILNMLLKELFLTHSFHNSKCKPNILVVILRKAGKHKWIPYVVTISRLLNRENDNLFLDEHHITRLVDRFREILTVFKQAHGCKFLNYDFITHQMLLMDGHQDLASLFSCHKTPEVFSRSMKRLRSLCLTLQKVSTNFDWNVPTQLPHR